MFVVSIGAGKNQIPLIQSCKDLGFKVIGVDVNPHSEGLALCDFKIIESIYNHHEIYDSIKELLVFDDVAAIVTRSYGKAIQTVGYLCQQFKLPYIDNESLPILLNKSDFRAIATKNDILMPQGFVFKKKEIRKNFPLPFPCIVKPPKGHAKQYVQLVYNYNQLKEYLAPLKHDEIIIEQFISGDEIIVIGFVYNTKFYICDISDKVLSAKPYFVDRMHLLPSNYQSMSSQFEELGQKIADSFNLHSTPLLMECIISNNKIYLIEAACEFGGEFLADYAIPARSDYNIFSSFILAITRGKIITPLPSKNASVVKYIFGRNGILKSYNIPKKNNDCVYSKIFFTIGSKITFPKNNHHRLGVIVSKGKSIEKALETADTVLEDMKIIIE